MGLGQPLTVGIHRETTSESPAIAREHHFRLAAAMVENGRFALCEPQMIVIYQETTLISIQRFTINNFDLIDRLID